MQVKEYTNRELGILLEALEDKIGQGFAGIHERQDKMNGDVKRACSDIGDLQIFKNRVIGALIAMNVLIVPLFVAMAVGYLKHLNGI